MNVLSFKNFRFHLFLLLMQSLGAALFWLYTTVYVLCFFAQDVLGQHSIHFSDIITQTQYVHSKYASR